MSRSPAPRIPRRPRTRTGTADAPGPVGTEDELDGITVEVRTIQPYQAVKRYTCPGCHAAIAPGVGHLVVVPVAFPEDRRHWHRSCWSRRQRRRPR